LSLLQCEQNRAIAAYPTLPAPIHRSLADKLLIRRILQNYPTIIFPIALQDTNGEQVWPNTICLTRVNNEPIVCQSDVWDFGDQKTLFAQQLDIFVPRSLCFSLSLPPEQQQTAATTVSESPTIIGPLAPERTPSPSCVKI
jgi:hypothetical protein